MAWSSFEKDKLLAEGWRKFLVEEQTVFGINSKENPESLYSFLTKNKAAIGLTSEEVDQLVALMLSQTKKDDVVLEAIGGPQRDARTFSSDTTTKLNALIKNFNLNPANEKKLEKVLNRWAKLNTVTFEPGEAATPAMGTNEPDEAEGAPTPAAEPKQTSRGIDYEPYGATDAPTPPADNLVVTPSSADVPDEEETETDRAQSAPSTEPAEQPDGKTPAQTAVDLLNGFEGSGQPEITVDLFNDFVRDLKSFIGEINKKKTNKIDEITKAKLAKNLGLNVRKLNRFFDNNDKYKSIRARLAFMRNEEALSSFFKAFEQVAKSLPTTTPAEPEAPTPVVEPEQAEERTFKSLGNEMTLQRLKSRNYSQFNSGRQGKMAQFRTRKNNTRVFAISNEEKYNENKPEDVEMAYDTWNSTYNRMKKIQSNILKSKVKAYLLGLEGWIKAAEEKSPTKIEESLMVRWKTIAGIK